MSLTPTLALVSNAILNNQGLAVSQELIAAVDAFNTAPVSQSVQALLAQSNITTSVKQSLQDAPSFLTGMTPAGVDIPAGYTGENVAADLLVQANTVFGGSVQSFGYAYAQAYSYASSMFEMYGALSSASVSSFNDYGFQVSNYRDLLSIGVTSQFDTDTIGMLVNEIDRLGEMFDVTDLTQMHHPASVMSRLVALGLGGTALIKDKLYAYGATNMETSGIMDVKYDVLLAIMNSVTGNDLDEVLEITGYQPLEDMSSLLQVLDLNTVFSNELVSKLGSLEEFTTKLSNIGGTFADINEVKDFYSKIAISDFERLNALESPAPETLFGDYTATMGTGAGPFENPTMTDLLGSAAGAGYIADLNTCVTEQNYLMTCADTVIAFKTFIDTHVGAGTVPDTATLDSLILEINQDSIYIEHINNGHSAMINIASRLAQEVANQALAGIELGQTGTFNNRLTLSNELTKLSNDPLGLHSIEIFKGMASDDVYGDALLAGINEANNLALAQKYKIPTANQIDTLAYANSLGV